MTVNLREPWEQIMTSMWVFDWGMFWALLAAFGIRAVVRATWTFVRDF